MSARRTDPWTSHEAGRASRQTAQTQRETLLRVYELHPDGLTDEEAAALAGVTNGGWKRCSELRSLNLIQDTGRARVGSSGRACIVCAVPTAITLFPIKERVQW